MNVHPLCELLPRMQPNEYQSLKDSIAAIGQLQPITVYQGQILDGRHRAQACQELGIEPVLELYDGDDPVAFVRAANFDRRKNYGEGQRAAFAVLATDWDEVTSHGGNRRGATFQVATSPLETGQRSSQKERALRAGCSDRTLRRAERLHQEDHDELLRAVAHGEITLQQAMKKAFPPKPKPQPEGQEVDFEGPDPDETELEALREEKKALLEENHRLETLHLDDMAKITELQRRLAAAVGDDAGAKILTTLQEELDNARADIRVRQDKIDKLIEANASLQRKVPKDKRGKVVTINGGAAHV